MVNSRKLLSSIIPSNHKFAVVTEEELALEYQKTENPQILAFLFCEKYYDSILKLKNKKFFYNIESDELASHSLECLCRALTNYSVSKKTKLRTLFFFILNNDLKRLLEYNTAQVRRINYETYSIEGLQEEQGDFNGIGLLDKSLDLVDLNYAIKEELKNKPLHQKICTLFLSGLNADDICEHFGYSKKYVLGIKRDLKSYLKFVPV